MCFPSLKGHQSSHASHMGAGHEHSRMQVRHHIRCHIQNQIVASDDHYGILNFRLVTVQLHLHRLAGFHTFAVLLNHAESVGAD